MVIIIHKKLEDYHKLVHFYDIAISAHSKKIDDFKKGKIKYSSLSEDKFSALLTGDLKRLREDQAKIKLELETLKRQLETQSSPVPPSDIPELQSNLQNDELDVQAEKEASVPGLSEITFTPDLVSPDLFSEKELTETLEQLGSDILEH